MKKQKNVLVYYIAHFGDYHDIDSDDFKTLELGCFMPKGNYQYCRYFGLFYKGKRPSLKTIFEEMKKKVYMGSYSVNGFEDEMSEEILKHELRKAGLR